MQLLDLVFKPNPQPLMVGEISSTCFCILPRISCAVFLGRVWTECYLQGCYERLKMIVGCEMSFSQTSFTAVIAAVGFPQPPKPDCCWFPECITELYSYLHPGMFFKPACGLTLLFTNFV